MVHRCGGHLERVDFKSTSDVLPMTIFCEFQHYPFSHLGYILLIQQKLGIWRLLSAAASDNKPKVIIQKILIINAKGVPPSAPSFPVSPPPPPPLISIQSVEEAAGGPIPALPQPARAAWWGSRLACVCWWASRSRWTWKVGKWSGKPGISCRTSSGCQPSPSTAGRPNTGTASETWVLSSALLRAVHWRAGARTHTKRSAT